MNNDKDRGDVIWRGWETHRLVSGHFSALLSLNFLWLVSVTMPE